MGKGNKFNKLLGSDHIDRKEQIKYAFKELRELGRQVEKSFRTMTDLILFLEDHINILEELLERNNKEKGKQIARAIAQAREKK